MKNIGVKQHGPLLCLTLDRPEALNALTFDMVRGVSDHLDRAAADRDCLAVAVMGAGGRAFCAGGDIKAAREIGLAVKRGEVDPQHLNDFFRAEYGLNKKLFHYPKPTIAIMNGITMGGGVGVAGPCRFRVATHQTKWAMPEVTIGFFPDIGAGYYLTRGPSRAGFYLGLTGQHMDNVADMIRCGFATHYVGAVPLEDVVARLSCASDVKEVESILTDLSAPLPNGEGLNYTEIESCFSGATIEDILTALDHTKTEWATATANDMRSKSPTSLAVTLRHLQMAEQENFDTIIDRDLRLAECFLKGDDFYEGVRAAVIDKDRTPKWAKLADIEPYFKNEPDLSKNLPFRD